MTLVTPPAHAPRRPPGRRRTRRRRLPAALYLLLALVVAGAAFAAVFLLGGTARHGGGGGGGSPGSVVQLSGIGDYVPSGNPDTHADTASRATDGDASTYWYTQTYSTPAFGGLLAEGLGLVLNASSSVRLAQLTVTTPTPGFVAHVASGDSSAGPFVTDSSTKTVTDATTFTLQGREAQYYVVWITQLPSAGYAEISEVKARS